MPTHLSKEKWLADTGLWTMTARRGIETDTTFVSSSSLLQGLRDANALGKSSLGSILLRWELCGQKVFEPYSWPEDRQP